MVGLEGFEPPTHGLGKLGPVLIGLENISLYYISQQLTNFSIPKSVLVLTRFEHRPTSVLLQFFLR